MSSAIRHAETLAPNPVPTAILILWVMLAGLVLCVLPCPAPAVDAPEPVVLQLKWFHQFQFAGYYAAKEQGYYRAEGLELEIVERSPGAGVVDQVVSGKADYGVGDAGIIADYANGKPLVALAAVFQHNPLIFISKQSSGIISPYEMAGKRIMFDSAKGSGEVPLRALLDDAGLEPGQYTYVPQSFSNDELIYDKVDVMSAYLTDQPFYFAQRGIAINLINPQNYGLDFYGDILFTSQRELAEHPGRAERFRRASLKGWRYALEHPDELAMLIKTRYHSGLSLEHLRFEAWETRKQLLPDRVPLGQLEVSRLRREAALLHRLGEAPPLSDAQLERFVHGLPTNLELTEPERAWLRAHPVIRLGIDRDFAPYEWVDAEGRYLGLVADHMRLIQQRLGVEFAIIKDKSWDEILAMARRGELDMIGAAVKTLGREQYLSFTVPYLNSPAIIIGDDRNGYVGTLDRLAGKKVAVERGYFVQELLAKDYPGIRLLPAANVHGALMMVLSGQADAYVGDAVTASHAIRQGGLLHLGFSGQTTYQSQSSIAVSKREPVLFSIIEKALASIPQAERDGIVNHWMGLHIEQGIKARTLLGYAAALALLFALFGYWIHRLHREVKARQRSEAALRESEARLSLAQSAARIGIWDWDMTANRATFSLEYYKLFGLPEGTPQSYEDFLAMLHPDDRKRVDAAVRRASTEEPHAYAVEYRIIRGGDGAVRWLVSKGQFFSEQGRPLRAMGVVYDITERKNAEQALREHEHKFRQLFDNMSSGAAIYQAVDDGKDFVFVDANKAVGRIEQLPQATLIGRRLTEAFPGVAEFGLLAVLERVWRSGLAERFPLAYYHDNHVSGWRDNYVFRLDSGLVVAIYDDLSEQKLIEEKLRLTARVFETTLESVIITDANRKLIDVNPAFSLITGYSREEALGKNPRLLKSGLHGEEFYQAMWQTIEREGHWSGEIWNRKKNGEVFPEWLTISALGDGRGGHSHYVGIASDISLLKQHEKQLEHIAHYDALTGIPNRVLLADRMKQAVAQTLRHRQRLGVCYLDLDGFKPINDAYGHEAGDWVLIETARRIARTLRSGDTVARLGGDEFAILLPELDDGAECAKTVERLLQAIAEPLRVADGRFMITASIGISLYPDDNQDPDTLLRHADQAMYVAKQSGKNRYHFYDAEHDRRAHLLSESLARIQRGIDNGEFVLFYQPKVDMGDGRLVGAEALLRWRNPQRGLLAPAEFLPSLENTELENRMGEWVIDAALVQLERWRQAGEALEISVNIAAGHLQSDGFLPWLRGKLAAYPTLPPGALQIEILETAALADIPKVARIIESCADMGVGFALDDFGTGYCSLSYLRRLPAGTLKIDQDFVRDMLADEADRAIIQGIIALARAFGRETVAEGVETDEHCRALLALGCHVGQGYGIARPMPAEKFAAWRRARH